MARQLVIKLNEAKFKPLLDQIMQVGECSQTYSESVGKGIFFIHQFLFEKDPASNKTKVERMLEAEGASLEESFLAFLKKYNQFLKDGRI